MQEYDYYSAAAHFGEPLFFCPFCLDEMRGLWYNGMVNEVRL